MKFCHILSYFSISLILFVNQIDEIWTDKEISWCFVVRHTIKSIIIWSYLWFKIYEATYLKLLHDYVQQVNYIWLDKKEETGGIRGILTLHCRKIFQTTVLFEAFMNYEFKATLKH